MKDYRKQIERHADDLQYRWASILLYEQNRASKKTGQQRKSLRASIARMRVLLDELEQVAQQDMVFSEIEDELEQAEKLATQENALAWCQAHRATIIFGIHGTDAVEVSIRTYPSVRAETLEQAVAQLQEIQRERKQQGREETL